ncbi:synembryn-A isoform X2 [Osmerus eperlanus]|uniref:synembryn-A isoform X2 n=1 Tax=Osmerus eperlanus TaxID=29151 RepID=UPI002E1688D9
MTLDLEKIIQSIKHGDQDGVQTQLDAYNVEYAECFFFNVEKRERRKQQVLDEFRQNKMREYVPDSDSDFNSDPDDAEVSDLLLRRRLAAALVWFIRTHLQPGVLQVCLRTLRILSRDRQGLAPLVTDTALLTLAQLGGISSLPVLDGQDEQENDNYHLELHSHETRKPTVDEVNTCEVASEVCLLSVDANEGSFTETCSIVEVCSSITTPEKHSDMVGAGMMVSCSDHHCPNVRGEGGHRTLACGKKEAREEIKVEEEYAEDGEVWRREAIKTLCNIIYNSQRAQDRASALRLLPGLSEKLKLGVSDRAPSSGQFYELRLLFLITALRPELGVQLRQERGVSMLIAVLEQCLVVQWADSHKVILDHRAPPVSKEVSQRAIEILKILFNITYTLHREDPDEEDAVLYRRLAAVLRHCLLLSCDGEDLTEKLQGHTVNILSTLPLRCLDVLLSVRLSEGSREWEGVNMDCVHTLLLFMEKLLDRGQRLKEKLTPVLNLLTESCRVHQEMRHYLKQQILPPLRDVAIRPEQESTLRGCLVRLMTNVDTAIKHCAAELLFVLCKENVSRFVKYTGYGNAAGLLADYGMLGGSRPSTNTQYSSDSDSDTEEYREAKGRINPVTGRVEEEQPDPMEGMTEEEKEEESRLLISMFNRLSQDKIIQPMGVIAEGRLAPLCGQMLGCTLEEEEETEGESEDEMEH